MSIWTPVKGDPLPPDFVFQELLFLRLQTAKDVHDMTLVWGLAGGTGIYTFKHLDDVLTPPPREVVADLERWQREGRFSLVHPQAVLFHLQVLRALARHTLAYLDGGDDAAVVSAWESEGFEVAGVRAAWDMWKGVLNAGLAPFQMHVRVSDDFDELFAVEGVNLFNLACLQMARYVAMEAELKRCANDRCRKPFSVQRGRARDDYGQHRSRGVRYCSKLCAKAQSERDRRRRRAVQAQP